MRFIIKLLARFGWHAKNTGDQHVLPPASKPQQQSLAVCCLETLQYINPDEYGRARWLIAADGVVIQNPYRDLAEFTERLEEIRRLIQAGSSITANIQNVAHTTTELSEFTGKRDKEYVNPKQALKSYLQAAEKLCVKLRQADEADAAGKMVYYARALTPTLHQVLDLNQALMVASDRIRRLP